jgi:ABC-type nitrate/sulfonate/bicarbonate transport system permease component
MFPSVQLVTDTLAQERPVLPAPHQVIDRDLGDHG